jgi:hypothetical protein
LAQSSFVGIAVSISLPEKPSHFAASHRSESPFGLYSINSIALVSHWFRRQLPPAPIIHLHQLRRSITKLYFKGGSLNCRRCINAVYASQSCDKHSRPVLQTLRLQTFLKLKTYIRQSNRMRLKARIPKAQSNPLTSKRLGHD